MGLKIGDTVQLKEARQGRRFKGKVLKIRTDLGEKMVVVSQPNNMVASFPYDLWEPVTEEEGERS